MSIGRVSLRARWQNKKKKSTLPEARQQIIRSGSSDLRSQSISGPKKKFQASNPLLLLSSRAGAGRAAAATPGKTSVGRVGRFCGPNPQRISSDGGWKRRKKKTLGVDWSKSTVKDKCQHPPRRWVGWLRKYGDRCDVLAVAV